MTDDGMARHVENVQRIYKQKLPEDMPETVHCSYCSGVRHLVKINDMFAFYLHRGKELEKCQIIGYKTSYLPDHAKETMRRAEENLGKGDGKH